MNNQVGPQKGQNYDVSPDDHFNVVPFPRSKLYEVTDEENRDCGDEKGNRWGNAKFGRPPFFGESHGDDANKEQNQRHPGAEINQPELDERHGKVALGLDPAWLPFNERTGVKVIGCNPDTESCRDERGQDQGKSGPAHPLIAENEEEREDDGQRHEGMRVIKGHGGVEGKLEPERQGLRPGKRKLAFARIGSANSGGFEVIRKKPRAPLIQEE